MDEWESRITELEIRLAWQDDLLSSLNRQVAELHQLIEMQQAQLRLLYKRLQTEGEGSDKPLTIVDEIPPHY